jgi:hypothetical protein
MEASDNDGLSRGYRAVLWPPDDRADPARTPIAFYSERARRGHLTHAELAEPVARLAPAYFGRFHGNPRGS